MNSIYRIRWISNKEQIAQNDELMHFGIKGQKWGVRRFQNPDGTLTDEGRKRYMYYTDTNHGRKMSLAGRIKFGKDVTKKTEADEEHRARKSIDEQNERKAMDDETAFEDLKKGIAKEGAYGWISKVVKKEGYEPGQRTTMDKAFDYINKKGEKTINKWWEERLSVYNDTKAWNELQTKYAKKLAKEIGLPQDGETLEMLSNWFINGDD